MDIVSIKLPKELNAVLSGMSKKESRSKSSMIRIILEEYLEDMLDYEDAVKAHDEWVKSGKKTYSLKQIAEENGILMES
ncbi:MAG: DUF6290 family protein [Clostridiales Family XIII bacterium]|jgi:predicted DNA-binding protein|nr:DUF6290 family protein [Clostridiales Family XIII bacterium]